MHCDVDNEVQEQRNQWLRDCCEACDVGAADTLHSTLCCEKHRNDVLDQRKRFISERRMANESDLRIAVLQSDTYGNGFVSKEVLLVLAREQLKKSDHAVPEEVLLDLMDGCALSSEEQQEREVWGSMLEREAKLSIIPFQQYHAQKFLNLIVNLIEKLDIERLIGS